MFFIFLSFVLGLVIGSFLNCVIYRLEIEKSITGRSYCPLCSHQLGVFDLIPVVSFFLLNGRCRHCNNKISNQYPLLEVATGLLFVFVYWRTGPSWPDVKIENIISLIFGWYIASCIIVIFTYDIKHYLIPDRILLPAITIAFLYRAVFNASSFFLDFFLAIIIGSGFLLVIFLFSRGKWMGFGDVKLAVLLGILTGFPSILLALFLAFLFGAIIGVGMIFLSKRGLKSEMPFAPFLLLGTGVAMYWGQDIIAWYFTKILNF